ncbi:MAG: hypothetical protein WDO17_17450 [Alphaproteobacteria bacterium]
MKIYLAGPLFSTGEREFNVRLAKSFANAATKSGFRRNLSSAR